MGMGRKDLRLPFHSFHWCCLSHSLVASLVSLHFSFPVCSTGIIHTSLGIAHSDFLLSLSLPHHSHQATSLCPKPAINTQKQTAQRQVRSDQDPRHKTPSTRSGTQGQSAPENTIEKLLLLLSFHSWDTAQEVATDSPSSEFSFQQHPPPQVPAPPLHM